MKHQFLNQATRIWRKLVIGNALEDVQFELEAHKKILSIFHVGDFYYYVFNLKEAKFDYVSTEVTHVLGYEQAKFDLTFFLSCIHPDDQSWFLSIEDKVTHFFNKLSVEQVPNYKVRYDYRVRKNDGTYIRLLQQVVTIQHSECGGVFRTFGVHTDITHLKSEGRPVLSFIGLNGEPSYFDVPIKNEFDPSPISITIGEQKILSLLVAGKKTKEIASQLLVSGQTVSTHRKNLIRKTQAKNSTHLVVMAIRNGWV